ncbi:MAG: class I SAM-dependent methyltransferase family protein, partial [Bauldia sp.]|nr:class I SAM-dependent methyltransferase family protein [Bauldia sp.]
WHPKAWYFGLARGLLHSVGRLSRGIRIGLEHGFDSGVMLDHVYANRAEGTGLLGRAIDRAYLNAPGWAGIRNRGALLEARIVEAVLLSSEGGRPVRLADLACGGGRYALGALHRIGDRAEVSATLRDYRIENVEAARANATRLGIAATIEQGDAFSDADLARLGNVDVAVVSGLHEIIEDDALVENHFRQIARILAPGGTLLVTVQPDHPQVEFIARVLRSHTGKRWAMRLRPLELTRRWLEESGFVVEDVAMEPLGIFGVVRARKAANDGDDL